MKTRTGVVSTEELRDELSGHERVLETLSPELNPLLTRSDNLKLERQRISRDRAYGVVFDDSELRIMEARIADLLPKVQTARKQANTIRATLTQAARDCVKADFANAVNSVALSRDAFVAERGKLSALLGKLDTAKEELSQAQKAPPVESIDLLAEELLRSGEILSARQAETPPEEIEHLRQVVLVFKKAIVLQEAALDTARSNYSRELALALRSVRADLVQRIASSYRSAAEATVDALTLQECVMNETGLGGESVGFPGIHPDFDCQGPFFGWRREMRGAGYKV